MGGNVCLAAAAWLVLLITCSVAGGGIISVNFDEGVDGVDVGETYAAQGVRFIDAVFDERPVVGSTPPIVIAHSSQFTHPTPAYPIVAIFSHPARSVSIDALDVGDNGVRLVAFDSETGGNPLAHDLDAGPVNGGIAVTLTVIAEGIRRVEMYQPLSLSGDGLFFDSLVFETVPEPGAAMVFGVMGLLGCIGRDPRRRSRTRCALA